jgi:hypothetical protein
MIAQKNKMFCRTNVKLISNPSYGRIKANSIVATDRQANSSILYYEFESLTPKQIWFRKTSWRRTV